ncbi:hypothetical protein BZA05DRAFT_422638 [Tricharina praecox]|uniref:uncharacterized protein n=1 Tax=Tricharina praecox TaxID=43433 RepID=UPI00221EEE22|nr:uncharacterized protein BZA05DRAFT_422638 [Tricharina praecox]KAI5842080.1 hypothetical protein BZA05DRAFT_422638 [Tricharina praecox]
MMFWFEYMLLPALGSRPTLLVMDLFRSHSTQEIKDWLQASHEQTAKETAWNEFLADARNKDIFTALQFTKPRKTQRTPTLTAGNDSFTTFAEKARLFRKPTPRKAPGPDKIPFLCPQHGDGGRGHNASNPPSSPSSSSSEDDASGSDKRKRKPPRPERTPHRKEGVRITIEKPKLDKLEKFSGRDSKPTFSVWCSIIGNYFDYYKGTYQNEVDKISFIGSRMQGNAEEWFEGRVAHLHKNKLTDNCEAFTHVLEARFQSRSEERDALKKLDKIEYDGNIDLYINRMEIVNARANLAGVIWQEKLKAGALQAYAVEAFQCGTPSHARWCLQSLENRKWRTSHGYFNSYLSKFPTNDVEDSGCYCPIPFGTEIPHGYHLRSEIPSFLTSLLQSYEEQYLQVKLASNQFAGQVATAPKAAKEVDQENFKLLAQEAERQATENQEAVAFVKQFAGQKDHYREGKRC